MNQQKRSQIAMDSKDASACNNAMLGGFHHGTVFLPGQASCCKGVESTYSKYLSPLQTPNIGADNVCETQAAERLMRTQRSGERLKLNEYHFHFLTRR